ncbi:MAG: hypothetical protein ACXWKN_16200 [Phenylobacterium sp.]
MRRPILTLLTAAMLALGAGATAAHAGLPAVVSADDEAEKVNPGRSERRAQMHPQHARRHNIHATLDQVFGEGRWRLTSGYRTVAQENALRRAGAGTVPAGRLSKHSLGDPYQPGAIDAVVHGMTLKAAAEKLRKDGEGFDRVLAEGAHGREGPHLHIELSSAAAAQPLE